MHYTLIPGNIDLFEIIRINLSASLPCSFLYFSSSVAFRGFCHTVDFHIVYSMEKKSALITLYVKSSKILSDEGCTLGNLPSQGRQGLMILF